MRKLGAHMSIAGGPERAFERSATIGGTSMQVFAKSPRGWKIPTYTDEQYEQGVHMREKYKQVGGMVHSNYLANLSKAFDDSSVEKASILHDFEFAYRLGYDSVNVHIGKSKGYTNRDDAMRCMIKNVEEILTQVDKKGWSKIQFVFENTAGQGTEIGSTLKEIGYFFRTYLSDMPVKFTIDTAHCQGGGVDLSNWDLFLEEFDEHIGLNALYAFHLNDSKAILGSKLDRHASLGRGFIGFPTLVPLIQRAANNERPIYIETPEPGLRPEEIALVKKIIAGDLAWVEQFHATHFKTQYLKKFESEANGQGQSDLFS